MPADASTNSRTDELSALQARIGELEAQLATQSRATAAIAAEAQEKLYWLERWHVDLEQVMRRPGALKALELVRGARLGVWRLRRFKRRLVR